MAAQIRFLVLLSLAAFFNAGFADTIYDIEVEDDNTWTRRTSNLSALVDLMLPVIRDYLTEQNLDPMKLNDMTEKLPGTIIRKRYIYLNQGSLSGLSGLSRVGDTLLVSDDGVSTLYATFGFDVLSCEYSYLFKDFLIGRRGKLDGRLTGVEIKVVANVNLNERTADLQAINIVRLDNLSLTLRGHVIDPVLNAIIKRIANRFRSSIISMIEKEAKGFAQKYLDQALQQVSFSNEYLEKNDILESIPTSFNFIRT